MDVAIRKNCLLIIAGGYDARVAENVEHLQELRKLAAEQHVEDCTVFLCSISGAERAALMKQATAVLYTPDREHFGIVPVEVRQLGSVALTANGNVHPGWILGLVCRQCIVALL